MIANKSDFYASGIWTKHSRVTCFWFLMSGSLSGKLQARINRSTRLSRIYAYLGLSARASVQSLSVWCGLGFPTRWRLGTKGKQAGYCCCNKWPQAQWLESGHLLMQLPYALWSCSHSVPPNTLPFYVDWHWAYQFLNLLDLSEHDLCHIRQFQVCSLGVQ
jgi:hypothetical protein